MNYNHSGRAVVIVYAYDKTIENIFIAQDDPERQELVTELQKYNARVEWFHALEKDEE